MTINSIGDLAMSSIFRSRNAQLKSDMTRLAQELSTGQVASIATAVGADFGPVSAIKHSLVQLKAYGQSMSETAGFAGAMQSTLETVRQSVESLSTGLLTAGGAGNILLSDALGGSAVQAFHAAVDRLNTTFAGRTLFAGTATDGAALADSEVILDALETAVAAETTASGVRAVVNDWFAPGGGFDTIGYLGSATPLAAMPAGSDRQVDLDFTAADPPVRDSLRGLAMSALIGSPPLSSAPAEQATMARMAGEVLLNANSDLLETQARLGETEATLEIARTTNSGEIAGMELALTELLAVDPFDSATNLEQAGTNLEILYALTARTARMKLTDYL